MDVPKQLILGIVFDDWSAEASVGGQLLTNLRYAEDTNLLLNSEEVIRVLTHHLEITSSNF